jgi:putative ABC transport system permease protein
LGETDVPSQPCLDRPPIAALRVVFSGETGLFFGMSGFRASMEQIASDVAFVLRALRHARAFTLTVVLTLAIGMGVATAGFSLTAGILFHASPFPNGHELHAIGYQDKQSPFVHARFGIHAQAYREQTNVFTEYAMAARWRSNVVIAGEPSVAEVLQVSGDTFRVLGIRPVLGRGFLPEEIRTRPDNVAIISDLFWRQQFNADANVLGRAVLVDQRAFTVIGVLGRDQRFPAGFKGDVYQLLAQETFNPEKFYDPSVQMIGRLRVGVTPAQAAEALDAVKLPTIPLWGTGWLAQQKTVVRELNAGAMDHTWTLFAAAVLLFAIACVNAMNLMLVRLFGRERELSIRLAIGASRGQIARLVLLESVALSLLASLLVIAGTRWLLPTIFAYLHEDAAARYVTYLNGSASAFIIILAVLASVVVALVPILRVSTGSIQNGLKAAGSSTGESRGITRVRSALVVLQAALAVILLAGTGLMMRTFQKLHHVDLGFDPVGKVKVWVAHPRGQEKAAEQRLQYFETLRQVVSRLPGVRSAAYGQDSLVVGAFYGTAELQMKDGTFRPVSASFVSPDYLRTAGITLKRGEWYSGQRGPAEAVINETMARERFGDEDPIGQYFSIQIAPKVKYRVMGVARDVRFAAKSSPAMHYYVPDWMYPPNTSTLLLQLDRDPPKEFGGLVRRAIYRFDPTAITISTTSIRDVVDNSMSSERQLYVILRGLSGIALALAIVGVFSVVAYSVQARTREFGVRVALGAAPAQVLTLVLRRGLMTVAVGSAIGVLGAMGLTRFMKALLFETTPYDPAVYLFVPGILLLSTIVACWWPARRAARVDPLVALRCE